MWTRITDCGKQLNINYRIRQTVTDNDVYVTEFDILEIDIDEYTLQLANKLKNGVAINLDDKEKLVLRGDEIIKYEFEVRSGTTDL